MRNTGIHKIELWPSSRCACEESMQPGAPSLAVFCPERPSGTALVICPGGGYGTLVKDAEGYGIAKWLNRHGITGIVLEYQLPNGDPFVPLRDAQRALRTVRAHAKDWNIAPDRVGIIGFSAGGHLASTAGTHFDSGDPTAPDPIERFSCRPDFMVLIYPVITMGEGGHMGSKRNLMGVPTPELEFYFSSEQQVSRQTPPAFLAHAQDDKTVVSHHSQLFYEALQAQGIETRYLKLPYGGHGLNGYQGPMWDEWQAQALAWLAAMRFIPQADVQDC